MSYILDAIRKSDLQRQRNAAPTLLNHHAETDTPQPVPGLVYLVGAFALLVAGVGIGWWRPWQTPMPANEPPAASVATPAPPAIVVVPIAPPPRIEREVVIAKPATPLLPVSPSAAATRSASAPAAGTAASNTAPAAPTSTAAPSSAVAPPAPAPAATPASSLGPVDKATVDATGETKTLNFSELPAALQQELPRMSVSVHAYSSQPKNRLVTIDDHMLHEGDSVAPGLRLEQITPDGMIFSYKGYRFRRSVKDMVGSH
jgi:general secretion pathway protein B